MAWAAMCDCGWVRRYHDELLAWIRLLLHTIEREHDPEHTVAVERTHAG